MKKNEAKLDFSTIPLSWTTTQKINYVTHVQLQELFLLLLTKLYYMIYTYAVTLKE